MDRGFRGAELKMIGSMSARKPTDGYHSVTTRIVVDDVRARPARQRRGATRPDLVEAKRYYDEFRPIVGLTKWFPTTASGEFNYGPDGALGPQIFFYQALQPGEHSRHGTGLQHLSFMVSNRAIVREAYDWAVDRDAVIVHAPRDFPEYGDHFATYFLDPHGFMLEVVSHGPDED